jgi:hypothetical protein
MRAVVCARYLAWVLAGFEECERIAALAISKYQK